MTTLPCGVGSTVAMAGRWTDSIRPSPKSAAATTAPVFPAETMAFVWRSFSRRAAMLIEESFFLRTEVAADSPISTFSEAWMMEGREAWRRRRAASSRTRASSPMRTTSKAPADSRAASMAPWMTTPGARSPPMASTPMTGRPARSLTLVPYPPPLGALQRLLRDHLFASVVAAMPAHAVGQLGLAAVGTERPGGHREFPVGAALLATRARVSSLGYRHGSSFPSLAGGRADTAARPEVSVLAAPRAESRASFATERPHGEAQQHRFADLAVEGEHVAVVEMDPSIFFIQGRRAHRACGWQLSTEDLELQLE